jgi:hypothetical protein
MAATKGDLVIVTVVWWVLIVGSVIMEIVGRVRPQVISPLSRVGARLATILPLRIVLWAGWIFLGVHLFTRYTLPRH